MIKRIAFTMYPVKDIKRSREFYEKKLGLKMTENFRDEWIEYDLAGGCFAITTMVADMISPSSDAGGKIAFEVDDVDSLIQRLKSLDVGVKLEPMSTPVCRMAVILDPDGNSITLHKAME